jgi:hypothetical protein
MTDLIERLRRTASFNNQYGAQYDSEGSDDASRALYADAKIMREAADELKRLRQRELDLLEERRMLRAEVTKAKVEAETWAECVAELRAEVERNLQDAEKVLDAFDSGLFIRDWDISRDHQSGWAMRYLKPLAALSRLHAAIEAARKKEV